jgi:hypothetical protein
MRPRTAAVAPHYLGQGAGVKVRLSQTRRYSILITVDADNLVAVSLREFFRSPRTCPRPLNKRSTCWALHRAGCAHVSVCFEDEQVSLAVKRAYDDVAVEVFAARNRCFRLATAGTTFRRTASGAGHLVIYLCDDAAVTTPTPDAAVAVTVLGTSGASTMR